MSKLAQFLFLFLTSTLWAQVTPVTGLGGVPGGYYAITYGVQANTQSVEDATVANASSTITCPNSDCNFTSADVGKIVFGTTSATSGTVIVPQGTITTINSAQSITVSTTSTGAATATLVLVWGSDDTAALNKAWTASASACQMLNLPIGKMLFQSAIFITDPNPACTFTSSNSPFPGVGFQGISINGTWLIPTPNFSFASCTGTSLAKGAHVCIGGGASSRYNNFTLWGAGNNLSGVNLGGAIFLDLSQGTGINQADILSWGNASTNSTCVMNESAQSGFYQGGVTYCGFNGMEITSGAYCGSAMASTFQGASHDDILIDNGGCFGSFNGTYDHVEVANGGLLNSVQDNFYSHNVTVDAGGTAQFTVATGPGYTGRVCNGTCNPSTAFKGYLALLNSTTPSNIDDGVTSTGILTAAESLNVNMPGSASLASSYFQGALGAGNFTGLSIGKSSTAHNQGAMLWFNTTVPYASSQTFSKGDPFEVAGSQVWLNGGNVYVGNSSATGATQPSGGGLFNVGTTNQFQVSSAGAITGASLLVTGISDGTAPITVTTGTTASLGGTYSSGYTFNQEATAATAVAYTLPTAAAGKQYCVGNSYNGSAANTGVLTVNTSASGQFIIFTDGTLSATGGNVTSGGAGGDGACFVGVDSTHWQIYVQNGTWTKH